ncbi:MAG: GTPase domain-containing protein [candidate division KSB1 bacterium]|nr:GTPase domain-containing protein [candidate division KSB1 bacterium]
MHIDWKHNEIRFKIVYYGPGLGGKTTNLEYIYGSLNPERRGKLISFKTREERTMYFDFMPLSLGPIDGKRPRFDLYTVPGQQHYGYGRKLVIHGADVIVFVADSQMDRRADNINSLKELNQLLNNQGLALGQVPWLLQYNKRDLNNIDTVQTLQLHLNRQHVPFFEASAIKGKGVMETLKLAIKCAVEYA